MKRVSLITAVMAVVVSACAGGAADSPELTPMTFMAGFAPQANLPFVGAYVAQELGYFAEEGLEVTIEHSAGGGEHLQLLTAGEVDVTTQDAAVLLQRRADPGLPLVSIGLIGQKGQQAFVALADSGIETPEDWAGRTIGYKGTPPPDVFAILDAVGLDQSDVELVNVGFDPRVLTEGQVDVYPVFKSNEPDTLRKWGFELEMWDAADYGAPTLGLTYVATEEAIEEDSEKFSAFMRAVIRGIDYARDDPEGATDIVMEYVGEDGDRDHQLFMLQTELQEATTDQTEEHGFGWQTAEQWQALHDFLLQYDALATSVDVSKVFTDELLP
ncbi:MAG TPA: ABC transporter substrate-binding protein [Acidimicrobiia bacterium]|jgi:ABC-type nitrate/sulfonate/bicarbonate transport system substrate-binding protein